MLIKKDNRVPATAWRLSSRLLLFVLVFFRAGLRAAPLGGAGGWDGAGQSHGMAGPWAGAILLLGVWGGDLAAGWQAGVPWAQPRAQPKVTAWLAELSALWPGA